MPTLTAMHHIQIDQYVRDMHMIPEVVRCKHSGDNTMSAQLPSLGITKKPYHLSTSEAIFSRSGCATNVQ